MCHNICRVEKFHIKLLKSSARLWATPIGSAFKSPANSEADDGGRVQGGGVVAGGISENFQIVKVKFVPGFQKSVKCPV